MCKGNLVFPIPKKNSIRINKKNPMIYLKPLNEKKLTKKRKASTRNKLILFKQLSTKSRRVRRRFLLITKT